ncbi:DNA-binding response OmpR family regulator [Paenibacillus aceris]|uniref:DNA-binding response OmpR family regulator n=1 Tax=Paenibacillus aceris TaxID=869555 RepID=A0ABS4I546_9BACL|nr:response regulator transcription factor [Paenibacillus aceris]MBP1965955.1 DNA-binding response OmpR family regulator [Paenibacillus aceris]
MKARIQALLRRFKQVLPPEEQIIQQAVTVPPMDLNINLEKRTLYVRGESVDMTFSEFELIRLLYEHPERVYRREDLINALRGFDSYVNDRAIDVHITNLRRKIEANPKEPKYIKTVWGVGYKFVL